MFPPESCCRNRDQGSERGSQPEPWRKLAKCRQGRVLKQIMRPFYGFGSNPPSFCGRSSYRTCSPGTFSQRTDLNGLISTNGAGVHDGDQAVGTEIMNLNLKLSIAINAAEQSQAVLAGPTQWVQRYLKRLARPWDMLHLI